MCKQEMFVMGPYVPPCCCWYVVPRSWTSSIFNEEISCLFRLAGWSCSLMFQQISWDAINLPENTEKKHYSPKIAILISTRLKHLVVNLLFSHNRFPIPGKEKAKKAPYTMFCSSGTDLACRVRDGWKKVPHNFYCEKVA